MRWLDCSAAEIPPISAERRGAGIPARSRPPGRLDPLESGSAGCKSLPPRSSTRYSICRTALVRQRDAGEHVEDHRRPRVVEDHMSAVIAANAVRRWRRQPPANLHGHGMHFLFEPRRQMAVAYELPL